MALDKDRLGQAIVDKIETIHPGMTPTQKAAILPYWQAIADAIVIEITTNLEVTTDVTVPGVTTGSSTVFGTGQENTVS